MSESPACYFIETALSTALLSDRQFALRNSLAEQTPAQRRRVMMATLNDAVEHDSSDVVIEQYVNYMNAALLDECEPCDGRINLTDDAIVHLRLACLNAAMKLRTTIERPKAWKAVLEKLVVGWSAASSDALSDDLLLQLINLPAISTASSKMIVSAMRQHGKPSAARLLRQYGLLAQRPDDQRSGLYVEVMSSLVHMYASQAPDSMMHSLMALAVEMDGLPHVGQELVLAEAKRLQFLKGLVRKAQIAVFNALAGSSLARCNLTTILDNVDGRLTLQIDMDLGGPLNTGEAADAEKISQMLVTNTLTSAEFPVDIEIYCGWERSNTLIAERRCS